MHTLVSFVGCVGKLMADSGIEEVMKAAFGDVAHLLVGEKFSLLIPRFGGMHTLVSFVGYVGKLMADSGIEEVMKAAFGDVAHMLVGEKFPQNVRAL